MAKKVNKTESTIIVFETFRSDTYMLNQMKSEKPSCFNGEVSVVKYKITRELVEEPIEVLQQRLQDLWDQSTNHHDQGPLTTKAKELNYTFTTLRGSKATARNK